VKPSLICLAVILFASALPAADEQNEMDWNRARTLHQKSQRGEKLSADEQKYLERAVELRGRGERRSPGVSGEGKTSIGCTPLTELSTNRYQGEVGGLYGGGRNEPPTEWNALAQKHTAGIRPLDRDGKHSPTGKVVLLSVGMSNTTQEFSEFQRTLKNEPEKSPHLVLVDGAQGGQSAERTVSETANFWTTIDERLQAAGVSASQVQVVWLKQAIAGPRNSFPANAAELQGYLGSIVRILKKRFPNLQIAYLSSRIYAGYATTGLNPEPHAYESAFAVRGLIEQQIKGDPELNCEAGRGEVRAPLLLWGPYLWADGTKARKSDGLIWEEKDFRGDGTHPSESGRQKVARQLLNFFKTDRNARQWFLR
jgi:hypothetical protein